MIRVQKSKPLRVFHPHKTIAAAAVHSPVVDVGDAKVYGVRARVAVVVAVHDAAVLDIDRLERVPAQAVHEQVAVQETSGQRDANLAQQRQRG